MNRKRILVTSFVALFIVFVIVSMMNKGTFSVEEYKYVFQNTKEKALYKHDLQELVVKTAKAFYYNREYIQYKTGNISNIENDNFSYHDLTVSPEDLNVNKTVYMDNASFMFSVYLNSLGINLSDGLENEIDIESGNGFDINSILKIIELNDKRLVFQSDDESYQEQELFISKYLGKLELGDIVVYKNGNETYLALYIGRDEDGNEMCIYLYDNDGVSLYLYNISEYLFPNNKFLNNDTYYAIIRPLNSLKFNSVDKITLDVPINSLARIDNVYVRRYSDVNTANVYRGELINYTIEVFNESDEIVNVNSVTDVLDNYLTYVSSKDGKYDVGNKTVEWNNIRIDAGKSLKFSYTVKVNGENEIDSVMGDNTVYGNDIVSNNARIKFNNNNNYLILNNIKYKIANKYIEEQEVELREVLDRTFEIQNLLSHGNNESDYKTKLNDITSSMYLEFNDLGFYSFLYYNAFDIGIDVNNIMNEKNIRDNLFLLEEDGYYTRNEINYDNEVSVNINNMVVDNLYGGTKLNDSNKNKIFSPINGGRYTFSNLVSGDIIIYWESADVQNSYLYVEYMEEGIVVPTLINFNDMGILKLNDVQERLEKVISRSLLYVVLRPSMIVDIKLNDISIDSLSIKVGDEKTLSVSKNPINGTIKNVSYSNSNVFSLNESNWLVKGLSVGDGVLSLTINDDIKKDVNIVVKKDIYDFKIITDYKTDIVDNKQILYVGTDTDVQTILNNIKFNSDGYDKKIYNNKHEEIVGEITNNATLEISLNGELVEEYSIINFSLKTSGKEEIVPNENIIKFVMTETKVSDLKNILSFNGYEIDVEFFNSNDELLEDNNMLGTGDYLIFKISDKLQYVYQIAVLGDVSGNGLLNGNDVVLARRHIVGWVDPKTSIVFELEGVYIYAMDYSMNGIANGIDVSMMRRKLVS